MTEDQALDLINRRRRQMHVHSTMYYHLDVNVVDDATFDKWAVELATLQKKYPQFKHKGYNYGMFEDWTGDTGMHLPVTEESVAMAEQLLRISGSRP